MFCDHASNHIPADHGTLGLDPSYLNEHIAWDIGAADITRALCRQFGCAGHLAGFSRLLIDPNRDPDHAGLIPDISDGVIIPGNEALTPGNRKERMVHFFEPYHAGLKAAIDDVVTINPDPLIISVHSFTPAISSGEDRPWPVTLLWKVDEDIALAVQSRLVADTGWNVGLNVPYSAFHLNASMDRQVIPRGLRHITFEIRQDFIDTPAKAKKMAKPLARALAPLIKM